MPRSIPNYLTIDPTTGKVGATFTGKVQATGLLLDEGVVSSSPTNALMWHDPTVPFNSRNFANDKGQISVTDFGSGPVMELASGAPHENDSIHIGPGGVSVDHGSDFMLLLADGPGGVNSHVARWQTSTVVKLLQFSGITIPALPATSNNATFDLSVPWTDTLMVFMTIAQTVDPASNFASAAITYGYWPYAPGVVRLVFRNNTPFGMTTTAVCQGMAIFH